MPYIIRYEHVRRSWKGTERIPLYVGNLPHQLMLVPKILTASTFETKEAAESFAVTLASTHPDMVGSLSVLAVIDRINGEGNLRRGIVRGS